MVVTYLSLPALMHVRFLPQDHLQLWKTEEDLDCMAREKMEKLDYGMRLRSKMDSCTIKTSKVPVLTPRLISDLRAPNNTSFIVDSDKYMFHTKDRAITLIT